MHALTLTQYQALKAAIAADGTLNALPKNDDSAVAIVNAFNALASPTWIVWKTAIPKNEVGKTFVASALAGITTGNNDRLANFAAWNEEVNPSRSDQRQFFDDVFSVAAGATTRAALLVLWKRNATRAQKLFSTGTGSDAVPATLASNISQDFQLTTHDVEEAWRI